MRLGIPSTPKSRGFERGHLVRGILAADLVWMTIAFFLAGFLRYGTHWNVNSYRVSHLLLPFLACGWLLWTLLFYQMDLDGFQGGWWLPSIASSLLLGVSGQMALLLAAAYLARQYVSRLALGYYAILLLPGFLLVRHAVRNILRVRHSCGEVSRVVIAGSDHIARELASKISNHPEMLCRVVGFLFPKDRVDDQLSPDHSEPWSEVSTLDVTNLLDAEAVDELILALPHPATAELTQLATQCQQRGIRVSLVPQPYDLYLSRPRLLDLDGLPILQLCEPSPSRGFLRAKRAMDIGLGVFLAPTVLAVVLPSALLLRILKRKAFLWDVRCGREAIRFKMLRLNVDRNGKYANRFEAILDRFSITELPQLWNVLKGEMSLVGPRPESPARTCRYTAWEQHRLSVRPGMTGLAQVHGLRDEHLSTEKARLDLQYILNPSLLQDFSLLLQTLWTLMTRPSSPRHVLDLRSSTVDFTPGASSIQPAPEEVSTRVDRAQSRTN